MEVEELINLAFFDQAKGQEWLFTPTPRLGLERPAAFLATVENRERVVDLLTERIGLVGGYGDAHDAVQSARVQGRLAEHVAARCSHEPTLRVIARDAVLVETVREWAAEDTPLAVNLRRAVRALDQDVGLLLLRTFVAHESDSWLQRPHPLLNGSTPGSLISDPATRGRVREILIAILYGGAT